MSIHSFWQRTPALPADVFGRGLDVCRLVRVISTAASSRQSTNGRPTRPAYWWRTRPNGTFTTWRARCRQDDSLASLRLLNSDLSTAAIVCGGSRTSPRLSLPTRLLGCYSRLFVLWFTTHTRCWPLHAYKMNRRKPRISAGPRACLRACLVINASISPSPHYCSPGVPLLSV